MGASMAEFILMTMDGSFDLTPEFSSYYFSSSITSVIMDLILLDSIDLELLNLLTIYPGYTV